MHEQKSVPHHERSDYCGDQPIQPDSDGSIKRRINDLLWEVLPNTTTLGQAELLAEEIWERIERARGQYP